MNSGLGDEKAADLWRRRLVFWVGAVAVGMAAVLFALASDLVQAQFRNAIGQSRWLPLLITPAGFALAVALTRRFARGAEGSGIPQSIAALSLPMVVRDTVLSFRIALGKIGFTLLGLLSGASVGREGPSVQIGASIMHGISRFARFPGHDVDRGLILAGGAAGIAAAFNTPLAGIVFAIEEMSRSFEQRTSGTLLIAVILAGLTALALHGNYAYFGHTSAALELGPGWLAVVACGVVGGFLGGLFSRILIWSSRGLPGAVGRFAGARPVAFAALCGLAVALLGIASGGTVYGTGYVEARAIVEGGEPAAGYSLLKMAVTLFSYLSGLPGGIFAPSLSVGAGLGAVLSHGIPYAPAGAVVILGMVAYFSGVVQTPITAFVIVMEMTDNHGMLLPLMAASFIGYAVSRLVAPEPIYQTLAASFMEKAHRNAIAEDPALIQDNGPR